MEQLKSSRNIEFHNCSPIRGEYIAMGESEKRFVIFNWKKGTELVRCSNSVLEFGGGYKMSLAPAAERCAVAGWKKGVELYDFNGQRLWCTKSVKDAHSILMLYQETILIMALTEAGIICLNEYGVEIYTVKGKFGTMTCSDDHSLLFCYEEKRKQVVVLNSITGEVVSCFTLNTFNLVLKIAFDSEFLAIAGYCYPGAPATTRITLLDHSGKWIKDFYHSDVGNGAFLLTGIKKTNDVLYSVYWNNLPSSRTYIQKMDLNTGGLIGELEITTHYMRTFDENADYLINLDGKVYDLTKMEHIATLEAAENGFQG